MFNKTADGVMAKFFKVVNELEKVTENADALAQAARKEIKESEDRLNAANIEATKARKFAMNIRKLINEN